MRRMLVAVLILVAFVATGCEAFKDNYNEVPADVTANLVVGNGKVPEGGEATKVDYSVDKTECSNIETVEVAYAAEDAEEVINAGWTTEGVFKDDIDDDASVMVEKVGPFTVIILISKPGEKLRFTLKQVEEKKHDICDVMYETCVRECLGVKSFWTDVTKGKVTISKFNKDEGSDVIVNAGSYSFELGKSNMGDKEITLEGSYFANLLGTEAVK